MMVLSLTIQEEKLGFGCIIRNNGNILYEFGDTKESHPDNTNNIAEYLGLELGLDWLLKNGFSERTINVFGDSRIVLNAMTRKKPSKGLCYEDSIRCLDKVIKFRRIDFNWIPSEQNISDDISRFKVGIEKWY